MTRLQDAGGERLIHDPIGRAFITTLNHERLYGGLCYDPGGAAVLINGFTGRWLDPARYNEYHLFYPSVDEQASKAWLKNIVFLGPLPPGVTTATVWAHQADR